MLQSQVNYWNLQETKRHNLAMEDVENRKADYQGMSSSANVMQAETSRMLVPLEAIKAQASMMQAEASKENVQVNWANAFTNARNADINQYNADTNRINAGVNLFKAETERMSAESQIQLNASQMDVNASVIGLNKSSQDLNYAKGLNEAIKYEKGLIELPYTNANNILNLIGSGAESFKDITSGVGSLLKGWGSAHGSTQKDWSNGISTFIKVLPMLMN